MDELRPCPFCGKRAELMEYACNGNYSYYAQCRRCHIWTIELYSDAKVIALWNTRTPDPEQDDMIALILEWLDQYRWQLSAAAQADLLALLMEESE